MNLLHGKRMRKGPHPLPLHIGIALAHHSLDDPYHLQFRNRLSEQEVTEMMRGIKLYQDHSFRPKKQRRYKVWEGGGSCLYAIGSDPFVRHDTRRTPLILVPSLINTCDILDLCKSRSMLRWLNEQGTSCYLFDWGNFSKKDLQSIDIKEIILNKLVESIRYVSKKWGKPVDCLGYCMGGTLLIAAQNEIKDQVRRMVLLAAPWNFHEEKMGLTNHVGLWAPSALPVIHQKGYLPAVWIQSLFATLNSEGSARKFICFASLDQESEEARLFVLVEDWLNHGVDLPAALAQHFIQEWFIRNATYKETWCIGSNRVDLSAITGRVLIVASERDRLVPFEAAASIQNQLKNASVDVLKLNCGHIGFIAGQDSVQDVWSPIREWITAD